MMEKGLKILPGSVYGVISMLIGVISTFISMSFYPDLTMIDFYISYLGFGPGLSAPIFNIGMILSGLIALPFFVDFNSYLDEGDSSIKKRKIAKNFSITGCIGLSLIGCFPAYNIILLIFHGIAVVIFFFSGLMFSIIFSLIMLEDDRFPRYQAIIGFFVVGIFLIFIFTNRPLTEWMIFFAIAFWVVENSLYLHFRKRSKN